MLSISKLKEEYSVELSDIPSLETSCQSIIDSERDIVLLLREMWAHFISEYKLTHSPTKLFFKLNKLNRQRVDLPYEDILTFLPTSQEPLLLYKELLIKLSLSFDDIRLNRRERQDIITEVMEKEISCLDETLDKDMIEEWTDALNRYKQN